MRAAGTANKRLSILSRMPPWPGIKLLESFTPAVLLSNDSVRSPSVPNIETTKPNPANKS